MGIELEAYCKECDAMIGSWSAVESGAELRVQLHICDHLLEVIVMRRLAEALEGEPEDLVRRVLKNAETSLEYDENRRKDKGATPAGRSGDSFRQATLGDDE